MVAFKIFLRKTGEDKVEVEVTPETSMSDIKVKHSLVGYMLSYKGPRKNTATVADLCIQPGETLSVVKTGTPPVQQTAMRMKKGQKRSTAHSQFNLHAQTTETVVGAVMAECQHVGDQVNTVGVTLGVQIDAVGGQVAAVKADVAAYKEAVSQNTQPNPTLLAFGLQLQSQQRPPRDNQQG